MNIEEAKEVLNRIDIKFFLSSKSEQSDYIIDKANECNIAIETVLAELDKKDRIIEEMIKVINASSICDYFIKQNCKHYAGENGKLCDVCIKEYFEKKVGEE